jgi:mycothiol S-conjugate amidase
VRVVREQRPHVMTTYDENGGYPHPDHIRCHQVSVAAFEAAGDPDRFPDAGPPWQPLKLYYNLTFHKSRLEKLHQAMLAAAVESPYAEWLVNWEDKPGDAERLTTSVPCAECFPVRDAALIAHATQVDPTGRWFACPIELQQETWPYEDFQLARSLVDTSLPEDDLFAGIRDRVSRECRPAARRGRGGGPDTGPIGLLIILLMLLATAFLISNMNGRIKRLPPSSPPGRAAARAG